MRKNSIIFHCAVFAIRSMLFAPHIQSLRDYKGSSPPQQKTISASTVGQKLL